jgi:hypothetical protein
LEISNTKEINHNILERKKEREKSKKILNFTTQTLNKTGKVQSSLLRSYQGYVKTEKKKKKHHALNACRNSSPRQISQEESFSSLLVLVVAGKVMRW